MAYRRVARSDDASASSDDARGFVNDTWRVAWSDKRESQC